MKPAPIYAMRQPPGGTGANRAFKPRRLHLKLGSQGAPWANVRYELRDGEALLSDPAGAKTDENGVLFELIDATLASATLKVWFTDDGEPYAFPIAIQKLPPIESDAGLLVRMKNLGSGCTDAVLPLHVKEMQTRLGLEPTGEPDAAFRAAVLELHRG